jgi:hypothetical protein
VFDLFHQHVSINEHPGEGIIDFMGHTRGQTAQGGNLFGLQQLPLGLFQLPPHPLVFSEVGQLLPHPLVFTEVGKDAHTANLPISFLHNGSGEIHRYLLTGFAGKGNAGGVEFARRAVFTAAYPPHHFPGQLEIVKLLKHF